MGDLVAKINYANNDSNSLRDLHVVNISNNGINQNLGMLSEARGLLNRVNIKTYYSCLVFHRGGWKVNRQMNIYIFNGKVFQKTNIPLT